MPPVNDDDPALPTEPVPLLRGAVVGKDTARVAVVVFSDFECPYCGRFARETLPGFLSKFVESGDVRFAFRHLPLEEIHRSALPAAQAAECARLQGKFWQMHDRLFTMPPRLTDQDLQEHGRSVGLDLPTFQRCLPEQGNQAVQADLEAASRFEVRGTPTFFIGTSEGGDLVRVVRRQSGAIPLRVLERMVRQMLEPSNPR